MSRTPEFEPPAETSHGFAALMLLWHSRFMLARIVAIAAGVFVLAVALVYVVVPKQSTSKVGFRLLFDGAEKSTYPNGMRFGPADVITTPILENVYKANALDKYGSFDQFKASLYVRPKNLKLEALEEAYRARISDTKLTPVDRQRIEREFDAQRAAAATSNFELVMSRVERFREMPSALTAKVLLDILKAYADDASLKKGAMGYQVSVPTRNMLRQDLLNEEDYIVSLDMLRSAVQKLQKAAVDIQALPGAANVHIGESGMGLIDIQSNLDDLLRFRISPMIGFVRAIGVTKNAALTIQYLKNQLFTIDLDRDAAKGQVQVYEDSLRSYVNQKPGAIQPNSTGSQGGGGLSNTPALIPQLGDSFFDRLIELGTKGDDTAYRQDMVTKTTGVGMKLVEFERERAYYADLISVFEGASKRSDPALKAQFLAIFQERYPKTFSELLTLIDNLNSFYGAISERNLNPTSQLVEVTMPPSSSSDSALSVQRIAVVGFLYMILVIALAIGALLVPQYLRHARTNALEA